MTKETSQKLIAMFVSDDIRRTLSYPFHIDYKGKGWIAATDGYSFIIIPETDEIKPDYKELNFPDLVAVIQKSKFNRSGRGIADQIKKHLDAIPLEKVPVMAECEACDGNGKFYHHDHWYDCKSCDETGQVATGDSRMQRSRMILFKIGEAHFGIDQIERVALAAEIIGGDIVIRCLSGGSSIIIFEIGGCYVGVMPRMMDEPETREIKEIEI